ncbi:hypothetical protein [Actinoalloteichus caeruleus]|uniref:hypothetical protein n=1 Tax=Actinoalloteichus cyanogriseus TaxID=2893586 RepID=UPI003AAFF333
MRIGKNVARTLVVGAAVAMPLLISAPSALAGEQESGKGHDKGYGHGHGHDHGHGHGWGPRFRFEAADWYSVKVKVNYDVEYGGFEYVSIDY